MFLLVKKKLPLKKLKTEHEEIQRRCIGKLLKRLIERHLNLQSITNATYIDMRNDG